MSPIRFYLLVFLFQVESWHTVYKKMNIPVVTTTASYHIKNAYKRYGSQGEIKGACITTTV